MKRYILLLAGLCLAASTAFAQITIPRDAQGRVTAPGLESVLNTLSSNKQDKVGCTGFFRGNGASPAGCSPIGAGDLPTITALSPALPDTIDTGATFTTVAGNPVIGVTSSPFTAADVNKLITIWGAGPIANRGRLATKITAVGAGTITVQTAPTRAMEAQWRRVTYGTDQAAAIQTVVDNARTQKRSCVIRRGVYMTSATIYEAPPLFDSWFVRAPPRCRLEQATIMAGAAMSAVWKHHSNSALNWGEYLNSVVIEGGVIDGNFVADYGVDVPFYRHGTRKSQVTMNTRLAGVKYGDASAPAASAGMVDQNNQHQSDIEYMMATVTPANPPVFTTDWDHGLSTGAIVWIDGWSTVATRWARVTVTGARTYTLDNTNGSTWPSPGTTIKTSPTLAGMELIQDVSAITAANPLVLTIGASHGVQTGDKILLTDFETKTAGVRDAARPDGVYTATRINATQISIPFNGTSLGTLQVGGQIMKYLEPETVSKAVYLVNSTDFQMAGFEGWGYIWGVYNDLLTSGWDAKLAYVHLFGYPEEGRVLFGYSFGGDTTITGAQLDCPARFTYRFTGPRNHVDGSRTNCAGFAINENNGHTVVRLEPGGEVSIKGGGIKGEPSHAVRSLVSSAGAYLGDYGRIPSFAALDFKTANITYGQPDSVNSGALYVDALSGGSTFYSRGAANATSGVCATAAGSIGLYLFAQSGGANIALNNNACGYVASLFYFPADGSIIPTLPTSCTGKPAGALWKNGSAVQVCP